MIIRETIFPTGRYRYRDDGSKEFEWWCWVYMLGAEGRVGPIERGRVWRAIG